MSDTRTRRENKGNAGLRVPPQDVEAEMAVLAGCLINPDIISQVQGILTPDDFYRESHKHIFEALCTLGKGADIITLEAKLKSAGKLDEIGGMGYLAELTGFMSTSAGWRAHAEIVKEKSQRRQVIMMCSVAADRAFRDDEELQGTLSELKGELVEIGKDGQDKIPSNLDLITRIYNDIERRNIERKAGVKPNIGPLSGLGNVDDRMCGFRPGTVTVLAGESGTGESAFAQNVGENISRAGKVLYFTLESTDELLMYRRLSRNSRIALTRLNTGNIFDDEWPTLVKCLGQISNDKNFILIEQSEFSDFSRMRSFCESSALREPIRLIAIDYLQLMYLAGNWKGSRHLEISTISRGVSQMAKALGVPVILISQLNKDVEKRTSRRPMLSDLKESGDIRNDAHNVIFLYADKDSELINVFCAKGKDMGTWETKVKFDKFRMTFKDAANG
jgi:replicative DNA helicase